MSAADWTNLQRRRAGVRYLDEAPKMAVPPAQPSVKYGSTLLIPRDVGASKIRFTASDYTNHLAARNTQYITQRATGVHTNADQQILSLIHI